jgi:hypothetical protein
MKQERIKHKGIQKKRKKNKRSKKTNKPKAGKTT